MLSHHNWKHFTKVLEKMGYKQKITPQRYFMYYFHPVNKRKIVVEKGNRYPMEYVNTLLGLIDLRYEYFVPLIKYCK